VKKNLFVEKIPSFKGSPCPMGFDPMVAIEHFLYPRGIDGQK